jgi:DNA replication protein DnaC
MSDINDIIHAARVLHRPLIAETASQLADQARDQHWTHEQYLAAVLGRQAAVREANGTTTRIKRAHFLRNNTPEDFNWDYQAPAPMQTVDHLATSTTA